MSDEKYTRCPNCATVFRVTDQQLSVRAGQVRCGQCKAVFDGLAQLVAIGAPHHADEPSTAANEASVASEAVAEPTSEVETLPDDLAAALPIADMPPADAASSGDRFAPPTPPKRSRTIAFVKALAMVVLLALVVGQAAFHFRESIAAHVPATRPLLTTLCDFASCKVGPLRDTTMSNLSIDASDLQADPAHRGLLILTATIRSRAAWPLAYPHLELTLTDTQGQMVVRRALAPSDYLSGTVDLQRGIAPNGEVAVKLFIDASATTQAGYQLLIFYP